MALPEPVPENQVEIVSETERSATFQIWDEDHTLGNALRYVLSNK